MMFSVRQWKSVNQFCFCIERYYLRFRVHKSPWLWNNGPNFTSTTASVSLQKMYFLFYILNTFCERVRDSEREIDRERDPSRSSAVCVFDFVLINNNIETQTRGCVWLIHPHTARGRQEGLSSSSLNAAKEGPKIYPYADFSFVRFN